MGIHKGQPHNFIFVPKCCSGLPALKQMRHLVTKFHEWLTKKKKKNLYETVHIVYPFNLKFEHIVQTKVRRVCIAYSYPYVTAC